VREMNEMKTRIYTLPDKRGLGVAVFCTFGNSVR